MRFHNVLLGSIFAGLLLLALPDRAQARGIPIIYNTGDTSFAERPLPATLRGLTRDATHMGYHCQHFGLFWITLWTWDGQWAIYNDKVVYKLPDEVAAVALGIAGKDPGKPFFYRFPLGLLLITVVTVGWGGYELIKYKVNAWSAAVGKSEPAAMTWSPTAIPSRTPQLPAPDYIKQETEEAEPYELEAEHRQRQVAIEEQVTRLLGEGQPKDAHRLYVNARQKLGDWDLPPKTLLTLIIALDRDKQPAEVLPLLLRYVEQTPGAPARLRLRLAQLLLTVQPRPAKALEVLKAVDARSLDEASKKIASQLRAKAEHLAAEDESELRLAE